ncbi:hypothetical protein M6D81_19175 [Paenibacillus sp. J5C_2022]|uniref:hypothetical protein n=1 Tax=Paenibacillus sp. J5C2022 TaxID=2977129 RepID=UPI0021D105BB|nr:hypothetical protein [Paenibacillus sp. J5C2022]MCU6710819.1 hypothetical protein [Paenibacillus sp. J5C2022]
MKTHSYNRKMTKVILTATLCTTLIFTAAACNNDGSNGNAVPGGGVNNESATNDAMVPDTDGNAMDSLAPDAGTAE